MEAASRVDRSELPEGRLRIPDHERQVGAKGEYRHRSGWPYVVAALQEAHGPSGLLLDDYVERTFWPGPAGRAWRRLVKRALPVATASSPIWQEPWVGIFHHPPNFPEWFDPSAHPRAVLAERRFRKSRPYLRGAIALSEYLAQWLREELDVPVVAMKHPTALPEKRFTWEAFRANPDKKLVQVGWYLRNYRAIYQVPAPAGLKKVHLAQSGSAIERARRHTDAHAPHRSRPDIGEVYVMARLGDEAYDRLITENVVFLELLDASANNAVIEAIVRETPLVVNRHPAVVEYLGEGYPLLYDDVAEVPDLVTMGRLEEAHAYLRAMDKSDLGVERFVGSVRRFMRGLV